MPQSPIPERPTPHNGAAPLDFPGLLRQHRLLAIVRGSEPLPALRTVLALAGEGMHAIEVSLTTPDALQVIKQARRELGPAAALGAGTVLTADDAARAAEAGASYMVTPALCEDLRPAAGGLPVLMGALTPSEVAAAVRLSVCAVKLFPASLGGPAYLRALREPFPHVVFVPVGGLTLETAAAYLDAGAVAIGAGSPLVGDAASGGDLGGLMSRAREWLAAVARRKT